MRVLACITAGAVIDRILAHLRRTRGDARGPPSTRTAGRRTRVVTNPYPTPSPAA